MSQPDEDEGYDERRYALTRRELAEIYTRTPDEVPKDVVDLLYAENNPHAKIAMFAPNQADAQIAYHDAAILLSLHILPRWERTPHMVLKLQQAALQARNVIRSATRPRSERELENTQMTESRTRTDKEQKKGRSFP